MKCPNCQNQTRTLSTRQEENGTVLRRRRECLECNYRFTTFEREEFFVLTTITTTTTTKMEFDKNNYQIDENYH